MAEVNKLPEERRPILKKCDKFLHKPTVKKMREHGAIIEDQVLHERGLEAGGGGLDD